MQVCSRLLPPRGGIEPQTMHSNDARRARQPVFSRISCNENWIELTLLWCLLFWCWPILLNFITLVMRWSACSLLHWQIVVAQMSKTWIKGRALRKEKRLRDSRVLTTDCSLEQCYSSRWSKSISWRWSSFRSDSQTVDFFRLFDFFDFFDFFCFLSCLSCFDFLDSFSLLWIFSAFFLRRLIIYFHDYYSILNI